MLKKILIPTLLLLAPAFAQPHGHRHRHHDFSDVKRWVEAFEEPARDAWQKPEEVTRYLGLQPGENVADIGAASGYFSRRFARAVGPNGWVFAVEVEPDFFPPLHRLAQKEGIRNIATVATRPGEPPLPPASVDMVFICNTLHHIENRPQYYDELRRALRPGGRIGVVDFFADRDIPVGPRKEERLPPDQVRQELEAAGWRVEQNLELLPYQYILIGR
jgi:arsenite methyltransferase